MFDISSSQLSDLFCLEQNDMSVSALTRWQKYFKEYFFCPDSINRGWQQVAMFI